MWEWVFDGYDDYAVSCNDCANVNAPYRVVRGGLFSEDASSLRAARRGDIDPAYRGSVIGARCARTQ
jgi:formylglycine-generating enzyme required for sulfatase activity